MHIQTITADQCGRGDLAVANGNHKSSGTAAPKREDLTPKQLEDTLPEYGGNSRIFGARRDLFNGGLKDQPSLQNHDIQNHLQQLGFFSSQGIDVLSRNRQLQAGRDGTTRREVSIAEARRWTAQANRDLRTIYRRASDETKDAWARQVQGLYTTQKNPVVRSIARDLNRRYERIQQADEQARRAARAARRSASQSQSSSLNGLFG